MDSSGAYPCDQCEIAFKHKRSLIHHQRVLHDGYYYPCKRCTASYLRRDRLMDHVKQRHGRKASTRELPKERKKRKMVKRNVALPRIFTTPTESTLKKDPKVVWAPMRKRSASQLGEYQAIKRQLFDAPQAKQRPQVSNCALYHA